jgi:hypothetical protein
MKRGKYLIVLCLFAIISTGCVKFNTSMDIKKDKSMDFSIVYALDKTVFGSEDVLKEDSFEEVKKNGFDVTKYQEGNYEGFTLKKNIKNIDEVSTESDTEYDLSGMMDDGGSKYLFKVEKGFLRNTYTAVLKFDANESGLNNPDTRNSYGANTDDDLDLGDTELEFPDEEDDDFSFDSSSLDNLDLSSLTSTMDLSFSVRLPYGSISDNATKKEDGKLVWNLSASNVQTIEFKFAIYNMSVIYMCAGVLLIIIAIIGSLLSQSKKNNNGIPVMANDTQVQVNNDTNNTVEQEPVLKNNTTVMEDNNQQN